MLSSKDILERTGISRATLNNYIAAGLVARPDVLPPGPNDGGAPRLGYYPDETVERIETIQRLKREGWSLGRIVEHFERGGEEPPPPVSTTAHATPSVRHDQAGTGRAPEPSPSSPRLLVVAVLAMSLHDADGLWVTLSVHDYFELVTEVEAEVRRIVRARQGHATRIAPYRFVCHFLPRIGGDHLWSALEVAGQARQAIAGISARWKLRRGWDLDVVVNVGLAAGEAWVSGSAAGDVQFVGDVTGDAQQLARFGGRGALLVSRDFIARLPSELRSRVVHAAPGEGAAASRHMAFARLRTIAPGHGLPRRVADMPVTEFIEFLQDATTVPMEPQ